MGIKSCKGGFSEHFALSQENLAKTRGLMQKYSYKRSAVVPMLHLVQRQEGWISESSVGYIADFLGMKYTEVYEVASFYTMFNLKPVKKFHLQVCRTLPCWLKGCEKILSVCRAYAKNRQDLFTLTEVECLGACVNAPVVQINSDYYEDLDEVKIDNLLCKLSEESQE